MKKPVKTSKTDLEYRQEKSMPCKEGAYLSGSGVIELILIMVVLIAIVILFKGQITALADLIFGDIFTKAGTVF